MLFLRSLCGVAMELSGAGSTHGTIDLADNLGVKGGSAFAASRSCFFFAALLAKLSDRIAATLSL